MAFSSQIAKKRFENLSIKELEERYNALKKNYCFDTKEEQISHIINNYLYASKKINDSSIRIALEELLKEKTGKEYKIEPKIFKITLIDIINYVTNPKTDPFWTITLTNYFQKLEQIDEAEKMSFLIELVQDKTNFNEFTKEILKTQNVTETYDKYKIIVRDYIRRHMIKA